MTFCSEGSRSSRAAKGGHSFIAKMNVCTCMLRCARRPIGGPGASRVFCAAFGS